MRKINKKVLYLLTAAVTLVTTGTATGYTLHKTITIDVDDESKTITGFKTGTIEELLKKQGYTLSDQDQVLPNRSQKLTDGLTITINHSHAVTIKDGEKDPQTVQTVAATTGDLLVNLGITLGPSDKIDSDLKTHLQSGNTLTITRREEKVAVAEEKVPFQTERQPDPNMYKGQEKTLTSGVEGLAKVTTKTVLENGKPIDTQVARDLVQEPTQQVVTYGTKDRPVLIASRSGQSFTAKQTLTMTATAYSMPGARTAYGLVAQRGVVAVDPAVIPLGTKLYIDGYGYAIAGDTGGAIKGNIIDLHYDTRQEALNFGRRTVTVYIIQ